VHQFDVPKAGDDCDSEAEQELQKLAEGLNIEDAVTQREQDMGDDEEEDEEVEGWANKRLKLSAADHKQHDESVRPIRILLIKVSHMYSVVCIKITYLFL
jgi:hypothetical protein